MLNDKSKTKKKSKIEIKPPFSSMRLCLRAIVFSKTKSAKFLFLIITVIRVI